MVLQFTREQQWPKPSRTLTWASPRHKYRCDSGKVDCVKRHIVHRVRTSVGVRTSDLCNLILLAGNCIRGRVRGQSCCRRAIALACVSTASFKLLLLRTSWLRRSQLCTLSYKFTMAQILSGKDVARYVGYVFHAWIVTLVWRLGLPLGIFTHQKAHICSFAFYTSLIHYVTCLSPPILKAELSWKSAIELSRHSLTYVYSRVGVASRRLHCALSSASPVLT